MENKSELNRAVEHVRRLLDAVNKGVKEEYKKQRLFKVENTIYMGRNPVYVKKINPLTGKPVIPFEHIKVVKGVPFRRVAYI